MFLLELTPKGLVYLMKLMDTPQNSVNKEDVMDHATIRQQLAQPAEAAAVVEKFKAQGAQEALQKQMQQHPPMGEPGALPAPK